MQYDLFSYIVWLPATCISYWVVIMADCEFIIVYRSCMVFYTVTDSPMVTE